VETILGGMKHVGGDMRNWCLWDISICQRKWRINLKVGTTRKDGKAVTMPRKFSTLDRQLEGVVGNVLGKHNPGFDTVGEGDIVLGNKDSIDSSIYGKAQGDETT
jgi:hypothetical protein